MAFFAAFALDANLRVLSGIEDPNAFDQIYQTFKGLPSHLSRDVDVQAPVLLIPQCSDSGYLSGAHQCMGDTGEYGDRC